MLQPLARLVFTLIVLFAGTLTALHARAVDPMLDELFEPTPGCSSAHRCFMGIRPGSTTMTDAITLLREHPWVDQIDTEVYTQVTWTWTGAQPSYIDGRVPGTIIQRGVTAVSLIRFQSRYPYGDIWLQLDPPEIGYFARQRDGVLHGSYYPQHALLTINFTECPAYQTEFWNTPAAIQFGDAFVMLDWRYRERSAPYRAC